MRSPGTPEASALYHRAAPLAKQVRAYMLAMENAPVLKASELHGKYRLLADFGGVVLAGRVLEKGCGTQFATWLWD